MPSAATIALLPDDHAGLGGDGRNILAGARGRVVQNDSRPPLPAAGTEAVGCHAELTPAMGEYRPLMLLPTKYGSTGPSDSSFSAAFGFAFGSSLVRYPPTMHLATMARRFRAIARQHDQLFQYLGSAVIRWRERIWAAVRPIPNGPDRHC